MQKEAHPVPHGLPSDLLQKRQRAILTPRQTVRFEQRMALRPRQQIADRLRVPMATAWRADTPGVESIRNLVKGLRASSLKLPDCRHLLDGAVSILDPEFDWPDERWLADHFETHSSIGADLPYDRRALFDPTSPA